ncbi:transcriptional regulator ATRX isoform X2 [Nasonia vitripennis]|uniref:Transcriptional regulator ATRX homolog n=1 Tax=Nasonia vitripennis TaxID=7425 RepID=A0A7M7Q894_NASVI|nr:transcriptional regulator ATRX isoform X2 [Nasonia vitripennis]
MATKNRTKGKDWSESSSDDVSDDDDAAEALKMRRISYVQREELRKQRKTQKVLSKLCDDDEENSSDMEVKKQRSSRLILPSLPIGVTKKKSRKDRSSPLSVSSDSSSEDKKSKVSKTNTSSKKLKNKKLNSSPESKFNSKKRDSSKKRTIQSGEPKSPFSVDKKIVKKKSVKDKNQSDSDSSKEFQKTKNKKPSKTRLSLGQRMMEDYSHIATPSKSDDESIKVETKEEISLKHYTIEEIDKIQKIVDEFKEDLQRISDYLLKKKINVLRDAKFFAHKILSVYDVTHEKVKESRGSFADKYRSWLDNFGSKKSVASPIKSVKNYKLSSDEVSDCDSDKIFSGNETRSSKKDKSALKMQDKEKSKVAEVIVTGEESVHVTNEEEDSLMETTGKQNRSSRSNSTSSVDLFESTASEVANTPVKSPILSVSHRSLRKTLLLANKAKNVSIPMDIDEAPVEENEKMDIFDTTDKANTVDTKSKELTKNKVHEKESEVEKTTVHEDKPNDHECEAKDHEGKPKDHEEEPKGLEGEPKSFEAEPKDHEIGSKDLEIGSKDHEDVTRDHEDKSMDHEDKSKDHEDKSKDHEDESKDHEDESKDHEDESKDHEDKSKDHEDKSKDHEDKSKDNQDELKESEKLEEQQLMDLSEISISQLPTPPATVHDLENEAREKLLADCSDSDSSVFSNTEQNVGINAETDADSEISVNSTCSTVIGGSIDQLKKKKQLVKKKSEEDKKKNSRKDADSTNKSLNQTNRLPLMKTKSKSISSDSLSSASSSDSAAEEKQEMKKCHNSASRGDDNSSDDETDLLASPLSKRRKLAFNLRKNQHYKTDKKLRMQCRVALERLSNSVLKKHAKALDRSKKYVANKKLKSMTNLDSLEGSKKRSSKKNLGDVKSPQLSETSNGKEKKKKSGKDEKKSLNDHLGYVENEIGSDEDIAANELNDTGSNEAMVLIDDVALVEDDIVMEVENQAKEALLKSDSNSSDDKESDDEVEEKDSKKSKKVKGKKSSKDKPVELSEDKNENGKSENESNKSDDGEEKTNKAAWKDDEVLNFKVTDTESEEEKFAKSQEKKEKNMDDDENNDEVSILEVSPIKVPVKKSQRKKRRILDSDSDSKFNSSDVDSDEEIESDEEKEEQEEKEEKKKKGRKRRQKSSDSDTSSSEKKPKSKRKRIKKVATDSDSEDQDSPNKGRKNIRKVLKDKHVADDTKKAAQDEEERLKRIAERQKLFNEMYDARLAGEAKVDKLVLDFDEETKQELVVVHEELVKRLKPHQAKGIKFMWDACFESLKQIEKSEGSGCIIAHCMGLGKTFQVVTLAHTLLTHEETGVRTVMVVCPLSTVLNWVNEFKTWLKHVKDGDEIEIYELTKMKKNIERKYQLESWQKTGGVLIIGYEMFRNLTSTGKKMRKAMQESIMRSLVDPGADLVVCDEGHLLKNEESALSKAMKLVKTLRRIVLTGTPLQNNLKEYHCMVQFVKPNLLGTKKEFLNRFVNPITNGQFDDSTPYDVKLMKKRAHVLHKMLEGSVQRFDYSVLTPFLPPKQEYVIFVRLTDVQIKMYQHYLDNFARRYGQRNGSLFADFQELQRIWTHPYVLRLNAEKVEKANEKKRLEASDSEGSLKDFIDDGSDTEASSISLASSDSNSDIECLDSDKEKPAVKATRSTRLNPKEEPVEEVPIQASVEEAAWWSKFVEEKHFEDLRISTKLSLLFGILKESEQIGDKVLVFSQSLYSLTLIEHFLNLIDNQTQDGGEAENLDNHTGTWALGLDYFRLDGSTSAENRSAWCKIFNNPKNTRARLFLISTRAGGLGINLTAANRVIIFDASWNPSHDVQSIFRIYRFGQKKPCYVYRFLAAGTMEEKIYNRQVTKLSLACRVVDEQQIERHYSNNDLAELYQFDSYEGKSVTLNLPKDRLLAEIFLKYKDAVYNYHEHDSLLENKEEEELDEEERKQAWLEYEEEKQGKRQMMNVGNNMGFNPLLMNLNSFPELESIKLLIQKDYPNLPPEHLDTVARQAVFDMYRFVDQQAVGQIFNNPFAAAQNIPQQNMMAPPPMNIQQQTIHQQNQLMNLMNTPQMNYPGVNQMPVYSGRGRPPKHLSMNNPMANMARQMQMPMQPQQNQMPVMRNNDEVEILNNDQQVTQPNIDPASNSNNIQKE